MLRYMGQRQKYVNEVIGYQQRLDELQAVILRVKLRHLETWIEERRHWAALYAELLTGTPVAPPVEVGEVRHVYYLYPILAPRRDELLHFLLERGIGCQVVYPRPVHHQPAYQQLGYTEEDFPVTEAQLKQILCLPMFAELTEAEVRQVAETIQAFFR
jgi:dTDP-4-amino-4,6-dideoxygalactose transaminase